MVPWYYIVVGVGFVAAYIVAFVLWLATGIQVLDKKDRTTALSDLHSLTMVWVTLNTILVVLAVLLKG